MKWIKKILKYMLIFIVGIIGVLVLLIGITIVNTNWKTERFRFENLKTAEELREYIMMNYPSGSDTAPLIALLKDAGAEWQIVPERYYSEDDRTIGTYLQYRFSYNVGWLYYPPLIGYIIILSVDQNQELLNFWVGKYREHL